MTGIPLLLILLLGGVVLGGIPLLLLRHLRALHRRALAEWGEAFAEAGETVIVPFERGSYRGARERYGRVKCNGHIALTDRRIVFLKLAGKPVEVPLEAVTDATLEDWFLGCRNYLAVHLVVRLRDGNQVGYYVPDPERWRETLKQHASP